MTALRKKTRRFAALVSAAMLAVVMLGTPATAGMSWLMEIIIKLVFPVTIDKVSDLEFGRLSVGGAGGTAVVAPAGTLSVTGDVVDEGGTVTAAEFDVTGHFLLDYDIILPTSTVLSSGGDTMVVNTFVSDKPGNSGDIPLSGEDSFKVGATLNVGGSQATGTYNGTFDVSVAYQ